MALQSAEPQQLTRLTVLTSGGETRGGFEDRTNWNARGGESIKVSQDLMKIRPAGGKETIKAGLAVKEGETLFNLHNSPNFIKRFGGEHRGTPATMTPEESASYLKANDVITQNTLLSLFLETRGLPSAARGPHIARMMGEYGFPAASYNEVRKHALESIARNPNFISMFPEVQANFYTTGAAISPGVLQFIEDTLVPADDHRLNSRLGTRMHEAYKKAVGFELVMTDEERVNLDKQIAIEGKTVDAKCAMIVDVLKAKAIKKGGGADYNLADVKALLGGTGLPDNLAVNVVAKLHLAVTPTSNRAQFNSMLEYADLPGKIIESESKVAAKRLPAETDAAYDLRLPGDVDMAELKALRASKTGGDGRYGPGRPQHAVFDTFNKKYYSLLRTDKLGDLVSEARDSQIRLEEANIRHSVLPTTTAAIEKSRDLRILQEEEVLGEIDGILGQSIADVLEERYDVMEERMGRLSEQQEKEKDMAVKQLTMQLKKKMSKNWIEYDVNTRRKEVHKKNIKNDVTHLAYAFDKDVALKQIIARDLFAGPNSATSVRFQNLNVIDGSDMSTNPPVAHALLSETQLDQLNKVFESSGTEYRDKLFADMFAARTFTDRTLNFGLLGEKTWGTLGFKRDEWKYMMQRYEPEITKGIEQNHEAHQALKSLEAQGVKVDFGMKWLLYILAVLFGGVGGGMAMGLPGAAAGIGAELATAKVLAGQGITDVNGNVNTMA